MNTADQFGQSLRERKKRETRAALSQVAIRLSIQHGWHNVTIDEIAEAANVSPRTFRNYFSTKAEAVAAGHLERMLRIADGLRARPDHEPLLDGIVHSVVAQFESPSQKTEAPGAARWLERVRFLFTEPAIHGEVLRASAVAKEELARAIAERQGETRENELYPQLLAAVVIAVIGVVSERWLRDDPSGSIIPQLRDAFDLVAVGLREDKTAPRRREISQGKSKR